MGREKMEASDREKTFEWLATQNLGEFAGHWIVVIDQQIVENGKNLKNIVKKARETYPDKTPFVHWVPKNEYIAV